jgi:hypothetical protein
MSVWHTHTHTHTHTQTADPRAITPRSSKSCDERAPWAVPAHKPTPAKQLPNDPLGLPPAEKKGRHARPEGAPQTAQILKSSLYGVFIHFVILGH